MDSIDSIHARDTAGRVAHGRRARGVEGVAVGGRRGRRRRVGILRGLKAVRRGLRRRLSAVGTLQPRAFGKVLLLPRGVLRADLVTVDTLYGKTLCVRVSQASAYGRCDTRNASDFCVSCCAAAGKLLTLSSGFDRNSMKAECTSGSTVRPIVTICICRCISSIADGTGSMRVFWVLVRWRFQVYRAVRVSKRRFRRRIRQDPCNAETGACSYLTVDSLAFTLLPPIE